MDFIIGCNYWASNAGTDMWRDFDEKAIEEDLSILSANGIRYLRVFPNWRDFQPVIRIMRGSIPFGWMMEGDREPENPYFLDETMLRRFGVFADLCHRYGMKLIVGLITGTMSGRLFAPAPLLSKNLFTDPVALLFEQRLVRGFVERFREHPAIFAWDLGNECNNMSTTPSEEVATNWTGIIANAIRAADPTRPVVSGMHGVFPTSDDGNWTIRGQAEYTDILTTHPYPFWTPPADVDHILSFRTLQHATCQTTIFADLGKKPCLIEETGTMGPMICEESRAADFMRFNLLAAYIHGFPGVMWWCANEQTNLTAPPYSYQMCEVELGMINASRKPKPVLIETGRMAGIMEKFPDKLPPVRRDAVCFLTHGIDARPVGYMTFCLAKQAGQTIRFALPNEGIPDAKVYMVPSVTSYVVMNRARYLEILRRVREEGATLYISMDDGVLAEFESYSGLHIVESKRCNDSGRFTMDGETFDYARSRVYEAVPTTAEVLARDTEGFPIFTVNQYGKGKVFYANFPLESSIVRSCDYFAGSNRYKLYQKVFADLLGAQEVVSTDPSVCVTLHDGANGERYVGVMNYTDKPAENVLQFRGGWKAGETVYGDPASVAPYDAAIFKLNK